MKWALYGWKCEGRGAKISWLDRVMASKGVIANPSTTYYKPWHGTKLFKVNLSLSNVFLKAEFVEWVIFEKSNLYWLPVSLNSRNGRVWQSRMRTKVNSMNVHIVNLVQICQSITALCRFLIRGHRASHISHACIYVGMAWLVL